MLDNYNITALKLQRQYITNPAALNEYEQLFRDMSPVPTVYWTSPGSPPTISYRAGFDDYSYNFTRREQRLILKGRFQNGSIGYIDSNDLELYAALYKKDIAKLSAMQMNILDLLEHEGPVTIQYIKEVTGLLVKEITPVLHKLQEAFLVYEDQIDNEGDRAWYLFSSEFQDTDLNKYTRNEALKICIYKFAELNVFINEDMIKSFYKRPVKDIKIAVNELIDNGELIRYNDGYMLPSDIELLKQSDFTLLPSVYVIHRSDYLVKSNEHVLKKKYTHDTSTVLHYILIDGEFKGAIFGRFTFGPFEIEDVIVDITDRRDEIIEAIYKIYDRDGSPIKRYNGK